MDTPEHPPDLDAEGPAAQRVHDLVDWYRRRSDHVRQDRAAGEIAGNGGRGEENGNIAEIVAWLDGLQYALAEVAVKVERLTGQLDEGTSATKKDPH